MSLLVTGRTIAQGGITTEVVGQQALSYLSGDVLNLAGRALGLSSVRIDRGFAMEDLRLHPTALATETDPASRLTITQDLTREVEVVLSQNLSGSGDLTWVIMYRPRRTIAFRVVSLDNEEELTSSGRNSRLVERHNVQSRVQRRSPGSFWSRSRDRVSTRPNFAATSS